MLPNNLHPFALGQVATHLFAVSQSRRFLLALVLGIAITGGSLASLSADELPAVNPTPQQLQFVRDKVQPLLQARCAECHGRESEARGGLRLTSRSAMLQGGDSGAVIVPHKPDDSLLISAVRYESFEMPPRSRMPEQEVLILEQLIEMGAPWPAETDTSDSDAMPEQRHEFPLQERIKSHWVWQPIQSPAVPEIDDASWAKNEIDQFIGHKLQLAGLRPAPDADRRVIMRRLYFDLIGLPPTVEAQDEFLNSSKDDDAAIAELVDQLLASDHFGERWGRHWLDLVRYAETLGHEFDYPLPYAWKYRDYVIRALNQDVPYDQFVREHIAGDLLPEPRKHPQHGFNESIIATGFWFLGEDKHAPVDVKGEEAARIDNQIDVFSKAFLGITVACARCHDHKFDAITAKDYYALAGFLQSSRRRIEWLDSDRQGQEQIDKILEQRAEINAVAIRESNVWSPDILASHLTQMLSDPDSNDAEQQQLPLTPQAEPEPGKDDAATFNPADPLSLLASLSSAATDQQATDQQATDQQATDQQAAVSASPLVQNAQAWSRKVRQHAPTNQTSGGDQPATIRFAAMQLGVPEGWMTYGQAFYGDQSGKGDSKHPSVRQSTMALLSPLSPSTIGGANSGANQMGPTVTTSDGVSSLDIAPKLKGSLHSPTFELQHPEVLVLVAGQNSRVRLVIDGYVMNEFSELLFHGAKQSINPENEFRWIRLNGDVHRYIGHQCHLEFLDEGDGWFCVKEIRFATHPGASPPQVQPASDFNVQLANAILDEQISTDARLIQAYADHVMRHHEWPAIAARLKLLPSFQSDPNAATAVSAAAISNDDSNVPPSTTIQPANRAMLVERVKNWTELAKNLPGGDPVLVMCDGSPEDEHLFIRGSHRNPGERVPRQFLTAFVSQSSDSMASSDWAQEGSGRLYLADQVTRPDNPLTSRVGVNRIWQHLLGRGIVASADNFGVLGSLPSHPKLLDYLAIRFQAENWSIKKLIKMIAVSRTYRQSSIGNAHANEADPTNTLLHRARVRRLEGEIIRDAILAVSGQLQSTTYGPPVPVHLTEFMQGRGRPGTNGPLDGDGRRSIYQSVNRNFLAPFLLAFDTPAPATAVGRRGTSNVPAQALILMNNAFVEQQTQHWAQRLTAELNSTRGNSPVGDLPVANEQLITDDQHGLAVVSLAFRQAFARNPTAAELQLFKEFAAAQAVDYWIDPTQTSVWNDARVVADICHVLLNQKEFVFLE